MKHIFVIEDSYLLFLVMKQALVNQARLEKISLEVDYADNLEDAQKKLLARTFDVISIDMSFPSSVNSETETYAGIMLVEFYLKHHLEAPLLIYSGHSVEDVRRMLTTKVKLSRKLFPEIIQKNNDIGKGGHHAWASSIFKKLT